MKTERRHELQENELANWLGDKIAIIRPYGKTLLGLVVLGLVALLISSYVNSRNLRSKQAGWTAYFDAMGAPSAEGFEEVSRAFPNTPAGAWALQTAGDLRLDESLRQMFQDRETAQQELLAAREIYEQVLQVSRDPMLKQRALFGLAKSLESQGELDQAQAKYEEITSEWPNSQIGNLAQNRLDELQKPSTKPWYTWFAEQKPVRSPLTDPDVFQNLPNLPDRPDFKMPAAGQLLPANGSSADGSPADGSPADANGSTEVEVESSGEVAVPELELQLPGGSELSDEPADDSIELDLGTETDGVDEPSDSPLDLELEIETPSTSDTP